MPPKLRRRGGANAGNGNGHHHGHEEEEPAADPVVQQDAGAQHAPEAEEQPPAEEQEAAEEHAAMQPQADPQVEAEVTPWKDALLSMSKAFVEQTRHTELKELRERLPTLHGTGVQQWVLAFQRMAASSICPPTYPNPDVTLGELAISVLQRSAADPVNGTFATSVLGSLTAKAEEGGYDRRSWARIREHLIGMLPGSKFEIMRRGVKSAGNLFSASMNPTEVDAQALINNIAMLRQLLQLQDEYTDGMLIGDLRSSDVITSVPMIKLIRKISVEKHKTLTDWSKEFYERVRSHNDLENTLQQAKVSNGFASATVAQVFEGTGHAPPLTGANTMPIGSPSAPAPAPGPSFGHIMAAMEQKFEHLSTKMMDKMDESRKRKDADDRAPKRDMSKIDCRNCGEYGHFARHCPQRGKFNSKTKQKFNKKPRTDDWNGQGGQRFEQRDGQAQGNFQNDQRRGQGYGPGKGGQGKGPGGRQSRWCEECKVNTHNTVVCAKRLQRQMEEMKTQHKQELEKFRSSSGSGTN